MKRVFLMSSERSGSNLLRSMLGAHPEIVAPPAVHFTTNMAHLAGYYGDLESEGNRRQLLRDMIEVARSHMSPWVWPITPEFAERQVRHPSFWGCMTALYDAIAVMEGVGGWVCKDNALFEFVGEIALTLEDMRVIYLIRDGRDVALSFSRAPGGPKSISAAADLWVREQVACRRIVSVLGEKAATIRYEDLIETAESELMRLCAFIGLPFTGEMLAFSRSEQAQAMASASDYWLNLNRPVLAGNSRKWVRKMGPWKVRRYEGRAALQLAAAGYPLTGMEQPPFTVRLLLRVWDKVLDYAYALTRRWWDPELEKRQAKTEVLSRVVADLRRQNGA